VGGGLDPVGVWATATFPNVRVTELDCEGTLGLKSSLLSSHPLHEPSRHRLLPPSDFSLLPPHSSSFEETLLAAGGFEEGVPSLFLSELVVSYLPEEAARSVLRAIAERGHLIAFELRTPEAVVDTVLPHTPSSCQRPTRHADNYFRRFNEKLLLGSPHASPLHSVFTTPSSILALLSSSGFSSSNSLVKTALSAAPVPFLANEVFDEHIALSLYLSSYYLITSKPCPHNGSLGIPFPVVQPLPLSTLLSVSSLPPSPLLSDLHAQIAALFEETYSALAAAHPPVRRMMKAALKSDLRDIPKHYSSSSSNFFALLRSSSVIGCVAVANGEIKRLLVSSSHRSLGLGTSLLRHASLLHPFPVTATTLNEAVEAVGLYGKEGWTEIGREELEGVTLITLREPARTKIVD